jgi:hypothetical protein
MVKVKRHVRWVVVDVLETWGEWEAVGYDNGLLRETALGRLAHGADLPPCSAFGPRVPLAVMIPEEVSKMGRVVADMRLECRAGERYYRLIRERYVLGRQVGGDAIERAISWIVEAWITRELSGTKKLVA